MFSLASFKPCTDLHLYGDSSLVINSMNVSFQLQDFTLIPLGEQLKVIASTFDFLSYTHIFRELNQDADKLSKEGLQIEVGCWVIEEINQGVQSSSQSRF